MRSFIIMNHKYLMYMTLSLDLAVLQYIHSFLTLYFREAIPNERGPDERALMKEGLIKEAMKEALMDERGLGERGPDERGPNEGEIGPDNVKLTITVFVMLI